MLGRKQGNEICVVGDKENAIWLERKNSKNLKNE